MNNPSTTAPPSASRPGSRSPRNSDPGRPPPSNGPREGADGDLDAPIGLLTGVGRSRAERLERLGVGSARDLLFTLPRRYTDRTTITPIASLAIGRPATVVARVVSARLRRRVGARADTVLRVSDGSGVLEVVFWGQHYLSRTFRAGETVALHGEVARFRSLTLRSPEFEVLEAEVAQSLSFGRIVPTYGLTEGLSQRWMRELVDRAVCIFADQMEETLDETLRTELDLPRLDEAIHAAHAPESLAAAVRARRRLAFEELLEVVLALRYARESGRTENPANHYRSQHPGDRFAACKAELPYALTAAQRRSLDEILADMAAPRRMHRLLEGDVGSGKTIVALLAALCAIDSGNQAVILAPTEILAAQHARTALRLAPGVRVVLLTGAALVAERRTMLTALARGDGQLAIGTHALMSDDVRFRRLGLVIVDEQHRFGVRERTALAAKDRAVDVLVMTATPIPRSLALTVFGDLDLSVIDERPPGHRLASAVVVEPERRTRAYSFLAEKLERGEQALVITPRIETEPGSDIAAATERFEELRRHPLLGAHPLGLLHGRLSSAEKEATMRSFRRGALKMLVATTIVEVGVDVEGVTVILIEHPERFGLGQLHQLRGRAGRAENQKAYCLLMAPPNLPGEALDRLRRFARTPDGFAVADLDLADRGPGELIGEEQHGFGGFRVADLARDRELVEAAHRTGVGLIGRDPELASAPALKQAVLRRLAALQTALVVSAAVRPPVIG